MKQQVHIFTTGGTIEKSYCEKDGSVKNQESQLKQRLIARLRLPHTDFSITEIMAKDSLEMDENDRKIIFDFIQERWAEDIPIVVLHGTDTMEKTLKYCYSQNPRPPVPIIFTGAMVPAGFEDSDARQNFTEALYAAQIVPPGFYISFHGTLFEAPYVTKDKDKGTFVERI